GLCPLRGSTQRRSGPVDACQFHPSRVTTVGSSWALLRHRLLRQPCCFERLVGTQEALSRQDLAVPQCEHPACRGVELDSTLATARVDLSQPDDAIAQIAELAEFGSQLLKGRIGFCVPPAKAVVPAVNVALGATDYRRMQLSVGIDVSEHLLDVPSRIRLQRPPHDVHVLVRNKSLHLEECLLL